jgi:hypothetical protein
MKKRASAGEDRGLAKRTRGGNVENQERKELLNAVKSDLMGEDNQWARKIPARLPGVWRQPAAYPVTELLVSWEYISNPISSGFDCLELQVVDDPQQPPVLTASFRAATGEVLSAYFVEPHLGKLVLLYDRGKLTTGEHWCGLDTSDPWQESLGRASLDRFIDDFGHAVGFPTFYPPRTR